MQTVIQVLSESERQEIHERSLQVLSNTGLRVHSTRGRELLYQFGAQVDEHSMLVKIPAHVVEDALKLAPRHFSLGARRPEWDLEMNIGECSLLPDGEATNVIDLESRTIRPCTHQDWLDATRLIDALDEIGLYWSMLLSGERSDTIGGLVEYWRNVFINFSKHIQLAVHNPLAIPWLIEVLNAVFGDNETIRQTHPISFLLTPQSPLVIQDKSTDAYLALAEFQVPLVAMPMPLMGGTAPGTMAATTIQSNCEVLAALCLVQAASPGTPFIYASAQSRMNPRTGEFSGGAVENGLLGAAVSEMARYYGLPVQASGGGSDMQYPGIQSTFQRAINALLPVLTWPDILVGPGLLGSSMTLSLEQLLIDIEVFNMCAHTRRGITTGEGWWLQDVISRVGPGGNYLNERSTVEALHSGEWFIQDLKIDHPRQAWQSVSRPLLVDKAHQRVIEILSTHQPLPLSDETIHQLDKIQQRAKLIMP